MTITLLVTAGRGPAECELVVPRLAAILAAEARAAGLRVDPGTPAAEARRDAERSITLEVTGKGAARWAEAVVGPVQWIATSPLRPRHRRRNWFVQVVLLEALPPAGAGPSFDEREVDFTPIRSGGPGGQRRNKVATAVRAEHGPSGRVVVASGERTRSANRAAALARLADLAARDADAATRRATAQRRAHHDHVVRGAPVRTVRSPLG